jgi:hypothetical protein
MKIKTLIFSTLLLGSLPFAAHSVGTSGPVEWWGTPVELQSPTDANLKLQVNSISAPEAGKPITAEIQNLTDNTLAVVFTLKLSSGGFDSRLSGYVGGYGKVKFTTPQAYLTAPNPIPGPFSIELVTCMSKGSGK